MIAEIDAALGSLVRTTGAHVRFDLPGPEGVTSPTISLLLLGVSEDRNSRHSGWIDRRDDRGQVLSRQASPRRYRLDYIAIAWDSDVASEHALLGRVLEVVDGVEAVPDAHVTEALRAAGEPVELTSSPTSPIGMHDWAALGLTPRATLGVQATVRLVRPAEPVEEAPSIVEIGVSDGPPARPEPGPAPRRPAGRIREAVEGERR